MTIYIRAILFILIMTFVAYAIIRAVNYFVGAKARVAVAKIDKHEIDANEKADNEIKDIYKGK